MDAHEALNKLLESLTYHAPPEAWWRAEGWARTVREALRRGEEAARSLDAALAREKALRERVDRLERALGAIAAEVAACRR